MGNRLGHTVPSIKRRSPSSSGSPRSVSTSRWSISSSVLVQGASTAVAEWDTQQLFLGDSETVADWSADSSVLIQGASTATTDWSIVRPVLGESISVGNWSATTRLPETAWTTDLRSRATGSATEAQIQAMDDFYRSMITAGLIPAAPADGTGAFAQMVPYFGTTSITHAMIAGIGSNPTNAGFADADRTANGSVQGDGSSYINTGVNPSTAFTQGFALLVHNQSSFAGSVVGIVAGGVRIALEGGGSTITFRRPADAFYSTSVVNGTTGMVGFSANEQSGNLAGYIYTGTSSTAAASEVGGSTASMPNGNLFTYARNNAGTADLFSTTTLGCYAIMDRYITGAEYATVATAMNTLMAAFGRAI